ncbi:MAG TPA: sodium:calcium antiporter [Dehalococcoidia bacterium]
MRNSWVLMAVTMLLGLPGIFLRLTGMEFGTVPDTAIFGLAIVASAFLLSWAAEAAEVDISQSLAVAFIALIAVLPEYAVDITFAWKAGQDPAFEHFAVANMTGANRLLIGAAWPLVFFLFWLKVRQRVLALERGHAIEVLALAVATLYSFTIPLKGEIALYDTVILAAVFAGYVYLIAKAPTEEPELVGPARTIGGLPKLQRRAAIGVLFAYAAAAILASAEPFAEGLVHSGTELGIDEFLLVQWLAPFASEAPEFLVAGILAFRGRAGAGMGALISSKVNQWTLLIGGIPVAYALSKGAWTGLPLDGHQQEEVLLTAAQSAFAVAILASLTLSAWEAVALFVLFAFQFAVPNQEVRIGVSVVYLVLTVGILIWHRSSLPSLVRSARQAIAEYGAAAAHERAEPKLGP